MLDEYVYRNLRKYGNCVISERDYRRYTKTKILADLLEHGLKCDVRIIKGKEGKINDPLRMRAYIEKTIILEVKNDYN